MNSYEPSRERAPPNPAGAPVDPPTGGGGKRPLELNEIQICPGSHGPTTATPNGNQARGVGAGGSAAWPRPPRPQYADARSAGRRPAPRAPPPGTCLAPISPETSPCCPVPSTGLSCNHQSPPLSSVLKQNLLEGPNPGVRNWEIGAAPCSLSSPVPARQVAASVQSVLLGATGSAEGGP